MSMCMQIEIKIDEIVGSAFVLDANQITCRENARIRTTQKVDIEA